MKQKLNSALFSSLAKRAGALLLAAVLCMGLLGPIRSVPAEAAAANSWTIIIGTNPGGNPTRLKNCRNAVIDVQYHYPHEVKKLKGGVRKIYSYMSIGSLETYRPYYKRFKNHTLGHYSQWADERWMDVGYKPWQDFIINELVASVRRKGCDGLWLDNFDVYAEYPRESVYKGLLNILIRLHKKKIPVYINGGEKFITRLIRSGRKNLIKGVFQEEVFTRVLSYSGDRFGSQHKDERARHLAYLKRVRKAGLVAGALEYTKSASKRKAIINYCKKNKYVYYISTSAHLK